MNNIKKLIFLLLPTMFLLGGCEYVESPDDTAKVSEGFITFPAIVLAGDAIITQEVGSEYSEPGFSATLGTADLTNEVIVEGTVNPNEVGAYVVNYSVSIVNELGQDAASAATRVILIKDTPSIEATDLSGAYEGFRPGRDPLPVVVGRLGPGSYSIDRILGSGNNIPANFMHLGGDALVMLDQPGPFGNVNTTEGGGTSANLTATGFEWNVFIGCCGVFGPVTFNKL